MKEREDNQEKAGSFVEAERQAELTHLDAFIALTEPGYGPLAYMMPCARVQRELPVLSRLLAGAPDERLHVLLPRADHTDNTCRLAVTDYFETVQGEDDVVFGLCWAMPEMHDDDPFDLLRLLEVPDDGVFTGLQGYYVARERATDELITFLISERDNGGYNNIEIVEGEEREALLDKLPLAVLRKREENEKILAVQRAREAARQERTKKVVARKALESYL
jgi:hypothetical protein